MKNFTRIPNQEGLNSTASSKIAEDELRISTIRLLLALAAIHDLVIHQMDVKTAFLNGDLDEEIYMNNQRSGEESDSLVFGFLPVCTPVDPTVKFRPNKGTPVSQLEYSRAIGCLMYCQINTRINGLTYSGYPSVIEGYSDASWINNMEDHSSTSGWVFLLGGGAISWASKKQTCITSSTMESEFVALAAAGNEAEWLRIL
ncbi:zinc finger, CCHC-type containing protein [Tanacetum coccineum]